jgi:hypothetical protein
MKYAWYNCAATMLTITDFDVAPKTPLPATAIARMGTSALVMIEL